MLMASTTNITMAHKIWTSVAKNQTPNYSKKFTQVMYVHEIYHSRQIKVPSSNGKLIMNELH